MQLSVQFLPEKVIKTPNDMQQDVDPRRIESYGRDRAGVPVSKMARLDACSNGRSTFVLRALGFFR